MAITFTATVIMTVIALVQKDPIVWVSYIPLFPLALLLISGLYLFVLPHVTKSRDRRTGQQVRS